MKTPNGLLKPLLISAFITLLSLPLGASERQGYFGAQLTSPEAGPGVEILTVLPGSPAAKADFEVGDIITKIDGIAAEAPNQVAEQLRALGLGNTAVVSFTRGKQSRTTNLTLGANPWQNADQADPSLLGVTVKTDISYTENSAHPRHKLDLYLPKLESDYPALLWIHGGGWSFGDKENERALAMRFAERGIAVAVMNYRLSNGQWADPEAPDGGVTHPAHVNDVADAFAWLHSNKDSLNIGAIYVGGHSAGGHLAALLASDSQYLADRDLKLSDVAGAIPIGGAYDIPDYHAALISGDPVLGDAHIRAVFGETKAQWLDASPTEFLEHSSVPMLVVVEEQAGFQRYARRIERAAKRAERSNVTLFDAEGRTHGNVILLMSGRHKDEVRTKILEFIRAS